MRRDVFQAIADPTRREIIGMVARSSLNLNAVADQFNISRPAISKHIKILTECGLIVIRKQGRERYCEAKFDKLNEVNKWLEQYKVFWEKKLDALGVYLQELQADEKLKVNKSKVKSNPPSLKLRRARKEKKSNNTTNKNKTLLR